MNKSGENPGDDFVRFIVTNGHYLTNPSIQNLLLNGIVGDHVYRFMTSSPCITRSSTTFCLPGVLSFRSAVDVVVLIIDRHDGGFSAWTVVDRRNLDFSHGPHVHQDMQFKILMLPSLFPLFRLLPLLL